MNSFGRALLNFPRGTLFNWLKMIWMTGWVDDWMTVKGDVGAESSLGMNEDRGQPPAHRGLRPGGRTEDRGQRSEGKRMAR